MDTLVVREASAEGGSVEISVGRMGEGNDMESDAGADYAREKGRVSGYDFRSWILKGYMHHTIETNKTPPIYIYRYIHINATSSHPIPNIYLLNPITSSFFIPPSHSSPSHPPYPHPPTPHLPTPHTPSTSPSPPPSTPQIPPQTPPSPPPS